MRINNLVILLFMSISSTYTKLNAVISATEGNDLCAMACDVDHNREIPKCNGSKLVPNYHETCGCLLNYQCCSPKCPNATHSCVQGREKEDYFKDSCGCLVKRCIPCPDIDVTCGQCQMLKQKKDLSTGCLHSECIPICIDAQKTFCPHCYHLETVFDHKCNCSTGHCIPKPCPEDDSIPHQDCTLIENRVDSCGCKTRHYDMVSFCKEANQRAKNASCVSNCHKKELKKDKCGCDSADCVQKSPTEELCTQLIEDGRSCPDGTYLVSGFSPCGNPRHTCLACPVDGKKSTCDSRCDRTKRWKDVSTGCEVVECVRRKCASTKIPRCRSVDGLVVDEDECGCVTIRCKTSKAIDENAFSFHSNLLNWTEAQLFCESANGHLAVIPDAKSQEVVKKAIGSFSHWVGARCRRYPAYSSFYWTFPNGTRRAFLEPQVGRGFGWWRRVGSGETCDGREGGIAFSSKGFDDDTLEKKRPFVCQYL